MMVWVEGQFSQRNFCCGSLKALQFLLKASSTGSEDGMRYILLTISMLAVNRPS
jgi:hypothetical protein